MIFGEIADIKKAVTGYLDLAPFPKPGRRSGPKGRALPGRSFHGTPKTFLRKRAEDILGEFPSRGEIGFVGTLGGLLSVRAIS
jgi:hypothetical protein